MDWIDMETDLDAKALLRRVAEAVGSVDANTIRTLKTGWLYCLLGQVRDDTPEDIRRNVERAVSIYAEHHGVILDLIASMHLIVFGMFADASEKSRGDSRAASKDVLVALGEDVRLVAFEGAITYGNIGTDRRMDYTALLPHFDRLLTALLNTNFGQITELGSIG